MKTPKNNTKNNIRLLSKIWEVSKKEVVAICKSAIYQDWNEVPKVITWKHIKYEIKTQAKLER